MQIELKKPDLEQFVEEQVKAGNYPSADAMVEAALLNMRECAETDLDDETIAAINAAEAQADRGEVMTLEEARAQMEQHMSSHG